MDKKKIKEHIQRALVWIDPMTTESANYETAIEMAAKNLEFAMEELSKSDWVSVEDGLPEYGEEVFVTSKMDPDNVFKNRRVESTTVPKDGNDFIILWKGRMARITHWKPIEKLEE